MSATLSTKVRAERPFLKSSSNPAGVHYELHTWKEYQISNCNTAGIMEAIRRDFPNRQLVVFPDPTGSARHTIGANVGETDHSIIRRYGASIYIPNFRTNSDKYNTVNGLLCNSLGHRRALINPRTCPKLVKALDGLCYREDTNLADKSSGLDHLCDAYAYSVLGVFPLITNNVRITTALI
jgi:hypothetical protein